MAPTTSRTKGFNCSYGRDADHCGQPIRMCELLSTLEGATFIERVALLTQLISERPKSYKNSL